MLYRPSGRLYALYADDTVTDQAGFTEVTTPTAVATTPAAVYYFADGSVFSFARVPPVAPTCTGTSATITRPAGTIALTCTDPRGEALTFTLDSPPAHGTVPATAVGSLGAIQVPYAATAGLATSDSFTFHVSDGLAVGATQTATLSIAPGAAIVPKAMRQVSLTFTHVGTLRVRRGTATLAFRCGSIRCHGTIQLLRAGHVVVRERFTSNRAGGAHVVLHLARALRPSASHRVHLRLRVIASAPGLQARTVARALTLVSA